MEISNSLAIGIGLGTVFVGLVCLILICYIMSAIVKLFINGKSKTEASSAPVVAPASAAANAVVANKGEFAAAIACAIAEDLGTDVTGIRIKSVKKL